MNNKITALIPTYQRPTYLRRAILSVLRQTYSNLQVSIFDNASGDATEEVVKELQKNDNRIEYYCHKNNIGSLRNFRYAFNSIHTSYFSILSDDDFLAKDFYENAIRILDNHPDIGFVILNTLSVDDKANLVGNYTTTHTLHFYRDDHRFDDFHSGNIPTTWTAMVFRKELAQVYAEMDDRHDFSVDMRFLKHIVARYPYAHLSKVGAFFTCHPGSFSHMRVSNVAHYIVQLSRLVDVYYDDRVNPYIKERAIFYLKKAMQARSKSWRQVVVCLKETIKKICDNTDDNIINNEVKNIEVAGFIYTSLLLRIVYGSKTFKYIIRLFFSRYYHNRTQQHRSDMLKLQQGVYKELFEDITSFGSV